MKVMTCAKFRQQVSLYVDRQMAPPEQRLVDQHLSQCQACRFHLAQLRAVSRSLGQLTPPTVPPDLLAKTLAAFDGLQQGPEAKVLMLVKEWAYVHSRAVAAVASFLITIVCYGGILGQLKPIPYLPVFTRPASINLSAAQYYQVNGQVGSPGGAESYTFPRVQRSGQVAGSLAQISPKSVVIVALIDSDGRAWLVEVLHPVGNPQLAQQVQSALQSLRFRPAMSSGRPVPTQLVMLMEQVEIRG